MPCCMAHLALCPILPPPVLGWILCRGPMGELRSLPICLAGRWSLEWGEALQMSSAYSPSPNGHGLLLPQLRGSPFSPNPRSHPTRAVSFLSSFPPSFSGHSAPHPGTPLPPLHPGTCWLLPRHQHPAVQTGSPAEVPQAWGSVLSETSPVDSALPQDTLWGKIVLSPCRILHSGSTDVPAHLLGTKKCHLSTEAWLLGPQKLYEDPGSDHRAQGGGFLFLTTSVWRLQ